MLLSKSLIYFTRRFKNPTSIFVKSCLLVCLSFFINPMMAIVGDVLNPGHGFLKNLTLYEYGLYLIPVILPFGLLAISLKYAKHKNVMYFVLFNTVMVHTLFSQLLSFLTSSGVFEFLNFVFLGFLSIVFVFYSIVIQSTK